MKSIYQIRVENLSKLLEIRNWKQMDLANALGRTPQQVNSWFSEGKGARKIGEALARDIEKKLDLEAGLLDSASNVERFEIDHTFKRIPVLSFVQAGSPTAVFDDCFDEWIEVIKSVPDGAFATRVQGQSMEPGFSEGDILVVDPSKCPIAGSYVVARRTSKEGLTETLFKQYALVGVDAEGREVFELRPLNNIFPTFRSDVVQLEIVGVVVECRKFFR